MENLNITIIQADLVWENTDANLKKFELHFEKIKNCNLVVLPEMFNTGFTMETEKNAQFMNGKVVLWLKEQAKKHNFGILGSTIINSDNKIVNRAILSLPNGDVLTTDKRHLFRMGNEHLHYSAGYSQDIFNYLNWRIRPLICYDLRFPVWSRNQNNYDLLIYIANWPAPRREAWKTLLKARAIENQCYVVGVNRVGTDGTGLNYSGDSVIINYKGDEICKTEKNTEAIASATINKKELENFREKFPAFLDADKFEIKSTNK